jgi:pyruvate dehydrogenase E2 component (dihydrolipoamide acetyltransferase)
MATKVHMEALSPTMEEGQVVKWLKSEGDEVTNGEVLAEIETDKATMELVARGEGVLRKVLLEEGGTAAVGSVIAVIAGEDEDISEFVEGAGGASSGEGDDEDGNDEDAGEKKKEKKAKDDDEGEPSEDEEVEEGEEAEDDDEVEDDDEAEDDEPEDDDEADEEAAEKAPASGKDEDGRVKASPVARRLAKDEGIDLASLEGSGPGGRIVKRDVEKAAKEGPPEKKPAAAAPSAPDSDEDYTDIPLSQMRKTIAKRLVESIGPVPHFFLTVDVDMSRVVEARARVNEMLEKEGVKVSFNDIVLKATAMALKKHPECNAHWGGDHVRRFHRVHLGVAVAVDDGLITPVIRDAERKGMAQIAREVRELAGRAREKKLKPEEYTGATFSVSNLGMFGIEEFTAVINPPEAGILAVGALEERPVVVDGEVVVRPRMKMTMSCDHRVIDGATGSAFLQTLVAILEEPLAALA